MIQSQPCLNASGMLEPSPARRASDYDWWEMPDDIDDDWYPTSEGNDRLWLEAFGRTDSSLSLRQPQHQFASRPGAQH